MESREDKYLRAKERVRAIKRFYGKLASYLIFMIFFAAINYYTNEWRNMWFLWIAFFWGIGIVIEGGKVFGLNAMFGKNWESKKIKEYMEREEEDQTNTRGRWQ